MKDLTLFGLSISPWVYSPGIYFLWISFFLVLRRLSFNRLEKLARASVSKIDDLLVESLELPFTLLIFTSGLLVVDALSPIGMQYNLSHYFLLIFHTSIIIALVIFLDRLLKGVMKYYGEKIEILRTSGNLVQSVTRIIVLSLGLLILLDSFGISIAPLVASLGIGSLAVALALQPTLENLFSGLQLVSDKLIRIGDCIRLESGEEGAVEKIGWRSTWIRLAAHNMIIVPNKVLVNAKVLNYHYPTKELIVQIPLGVHYNSDLGKVERVTEDVARQILREVPGGVPNFSPIVRYQKFGDFSIDFIVTLQAREFADIGLLRHEFIKRLQERFAKEGIVIPYPTQAVNTTQEHADPALTRKY
jgi:small-conductance mechanosensitive channel